MKYIAEIDSDENGHSIYSLYKVFDEDIVFQVRSKNKNYYEVTVSETLFQINNSEFNLSNKLIDVEKKQIHNNMNDAIKYLIKQLFS